MFPFLPAKESDHKKKWRLNSNYIKSEKPKLEFKTFLKDVMDLTRVCPAAILEW